MDYERIHKPFPPQSGGFSPGKLRTMLLGVEKRRKEEKVEEEEQLRVEDGRASAAESCRDVDVVSSAEMASGGGQRPRVRAQEEENFDSESVSSSSAGFEFQRSERGLHRGSSLVPPYSKPAPSKWDDAQKWIASPTSNRGSKAGGEKVRRPGFGGYGGGRGAAKVVVEVSEDADTKRVDPSLAKREVDGHKSVNWVGESYRGADSVMKPAIVVEKPVSDSAINLNQHDSSTYSQSAATFVTPPSTVKSVSMRDIGTEMTPLASQEPSRTGTPMRATTPIRSPTSSRPSSPQRTAPDSVPTISTDRYGDATRKELSEKELQMKTKREILVLGQQLGKSNITAWASKEGEETDAVSDSVKTVTPDQTAKRVVETRAAAWEEAEKAKYLARFKREEIKIQAWENHQKAKTEAEMRKVEVEVEKMRARAHEKLMNKLAAARHKAEEKRAAAEAQKNKQAVRTAEQAEYIRRTGRIPSSFSCWGWCS